MSRLVGNQKKAHYVSRNKEGWRRLKNYPAYEVSNYGRVRASARTDADGFLKPRWFRGKPFVVLSAGAKNRYERSIFWLMSDAGWIKEKRSLWLGMDVKGLTAAHLSDLVDLYRAKLREVGVDMIPNTDDPHSTDAKVCQADPNHVLTVSFYPADSRDPNKIDVFCYECQQKGMPQMTLRAVLGRLENRAVPVTV